MKSPLQLWRESKCRMFGHLRAKGVPSATLLHTNVYTCPRCQAFWLRKRKQPKGT